MRIGGDHFLQRIFVAAITAVPVGMITADQCRVTIAQVLSVGIERQVERPHRLAILGGEQFSILPQPVLGSHLPRSLAKTRADRVERGWRDGRDGRRESQEAVWIAVTFELWARQFLDGIPGGNPIQPRPMARRQPQTDVEVASRG